ncbi:Acetyltransferase (GNAT) family protein [Peptostreptococcaceae bacterium pGA-8]|nr:Acetyltransferase (GNAT) family protein [Peptostreptococcaceae bacterium pGA-8]
MVDFHICTPDDESIWIELNKEFMDYEINEDDIWGDANKASREVFAKTFKEALENPEMITPVLIMDGEKPVGIINLMSIFSIWSHGKAMIIDDLYIRDEYQGEGMGKMAMEYVEKLAKDKGFNRLQFYSSKQNLRAREFYKHLGFMPSEMNIYVKHLNRKERDV